MWKKTRKVRSIEEGLEAIASGEAISLRATAEIDGREYTATFVPKEFPEKPPVTLPDISPSLRIMRLSAELQKALFDSEDNRLISEMPWLTLPPGYSFKVTFPFLGAAARFRVRKDDRPDRDVSVFLDTQNVLGYFGSFSKPQPYWEVYPIGDDAARFAFHETKEMIDAIVEELNADQPSDQAPA